MQRFLLLFCLTFLCNFLLAQNIYTIKADSVKITNCDSSELIINNHSQGVPGFLYNTGRGRTRFQRGAIKINDSLYLIGVDTLHLNSGGGAVAGSNVFYVSKRYTGTARAVIGGNTLASVSSVNTSYTGQLAKAARGSMSLSYPDPFSARNAALDAIAAGKITGAEIVILEGSKYTIGSSDSTKNGSVDGLNPNNGTVADIQFDSATLVSDTSISSIMKNGINLYFSLGTNLTFVNSSYAIYCLFNNDTTNFKSSVYGLGSFYQVYGEVNSFSASFAKINNRYSYSSFHAHEVILQQYSGFHFENYSTCNIDIENLMTADANVFLIGRRINSGYGTPISGNVANAPRALSIKVKNVRFGKGQTPYPDSNDIWYCILLAENALMEGTIVNVDIGNLYMNATNEAPLFTVNTWATLYNVNLTVNIDNLIQRDSHIHNSGIHGGLIDCYNAGVAINNCITYNIKSASIAAPLLGMMNFSSYAQNKSNRFNINVGDLRKDSSAYNGGIFDLTSMLSQVGEPMLISIKGNFKSYDNKPMIFAYNNWYSYPFANHYVFSGKYEMADSGLPVVHFYANTGKIVAITDAVLINDGITPCIMADSVCDNTYCNCCQLTSPLNIPVYIMNVHANSAPGENIQQIGDSIKVYSGISSFYY